MSASGPRALAEAEAIVGRITQMTAAEQLRLAANLAEAGVLDIAVEVTKMAILRMRGARPSTPEVAS